MQITLENFYRALLQMRSCFKKQCRQKFIQSFGEKHYTFTLEDWVFTADYSKEKLCVHFDVNSLKGFGVEDLSVGTLQQEQCYTICQKRNTII